MGLDPGRHICNILKCRPPGNRNPGEDEIAACEPFLLKQLDAIDPEIICALGNVCRQDAAADRVADLAIREVPRLPRAQTHDAITRPTSCATPARRRWSGKTCRKS